jgi:hypothetical protein
MNGRRVFTASFCRSIAVAMLTAAVSLAIFSRAALGASQQPTSTVAPSIAGTFKPGQVLTASAGQWSDEPGEFKYRWEVCDPTGAQCKIVREFGSDPSYLLEPRDALGYIRVQVVASNSFGSGSPAASALQKVETAWEWVVGPPKVEAATRWSAQPCCGKAEKLGTRTLEVSVLTGYCVGEPPPELDHISVIERPVTARRPFRSAVVTVFLRFPQPREVVGTVNRGEPIAACAGLGYGFSGRVKLKRPVEKLFIFDGRRRPLRLVRRPHLEVPRAASR